MSLEVVISRTDHQIRKSQRIHSADGPRRAQFWYLPLIPPPYLWEMRFKVRHLIHAMHWSAKQAARRIPSPSYLVVPPLALQKLAHLTRFQPSKEGVISRTHWAGPVMRGVVSNTQGQVLITHNDFRQLIELVSLNVTQVLYLPSRLHSMCVQQRCHRTANIRSRHSAKRRSADPCPVEIEVEARTPNDAIISKMKTYSRRLRGISMGETGG